MIETRQARLSALAATFWTVERLGRTVMEEIDGLLGKAEGYFGRTITIIGVAIIGLGTVSASMRSIWQNIVAPLWDRTSGTGIPMDVVWNVSQAGILIGLACIFVSDYLKYRDLRSNLKQTKQLLAETNEALEEANQASETFNRTNATMRDKMATAELMIQALTAILQTQGLIGQEKCDLILSLLDTESEKLP